MQLLGRNQQRWIQFPLSSHKFCLFWLNFIFPMGTVLSIFSWTDWMKNASSYCQHTVLQMEVIIITPMVLIEQLLIQQSRKKINIKANIIISNFHLFLKTTKLFDFLESGNTEIPSRF